MHVKIYQSWHVSLQVDTLQFGMYVLLAWFLRFSSSKQKKKFAWLRHRLVSLSLKNVILLFAWLFWLLSSMFRLIWLFVGFVVWRSETIYSNFPDSVGSKRDTSWPLTNLSSLPFLWIFKLSILIVSDVLCCVIYQFRIVCHHGPQSELTR